MKRFARLLLVTVGFGTLGFVISLVPQKSATGAGSAPVNIMSPLPLPVTGSVNANITNTSAVPVSVSNTPTVNANVTFPSSLPVTLPSHLGLSSNQFVTLFSDSGGPTWSVLSTNGGEPRSFTIPNGQVLVITDFELEVFNGTAGGVQKIFLTNRPAGFGPPTWIGVVPLDSSGIGLADFHITSGVVTTVLPTIAPFALGGGTVDEVSVQGYLTTQQ